MPNWKKKNKRLKLWVYHFIFIGKPKTSMTN